VCKKRIDDKEECRRISGNFDWNAGEAVWCGAHRSMDHIWGFTRSHWMPPSGECLRRIAPVAARVNEFVETTQNTIKKLFLAS
jgi:hypothetical protein